MLLNWQKIHFLIDLNLKMSSFSFCNHCLEHFKNTKKFVDYVFFLLFAWILALIAIFKSCMKSKQQEVRGQGKIFPRGVKWGINKNFGEEIAIHFKVILVSQLNLIQCIYRHFKYVNFMIAYYTFLHIFHSSKCHLLFLVKSFSFFREVYIKNQLK